MLTHLKIYKVRAGTAYTKVWWAKVSMGVLKSKTQKYILFKRYTIYIIIPDQNNCWAEATKRKAREVSKLCILLCFAIPLCSRVCEHVVLYKISWSWNKVNGVILSNSLPL